MLVLLLAVQCRVGGKIFGKKTTQAPSENPSSKSGEVIIPTWSDTVFNNLTPDERIGQLFMVAAYSNKGSQHVEEITKLITDHKIGGLIFFQGGPGRQAKLTNLYQSQSRVPLLVSIDGEWGLAMRLDSTIKYPRQMSLGAIENDSLVYFMGKEIARQCKRMGIHVNLAPVVDINNNPRNPVISNRSFGEDKYNVSRKGIMYMKGMQDARVMANAKHFPGHGDTDSDSHKTLPLISHSRIRMDSVELYPFRELIREGLSSMMIAHLFMPAYDTTQNQASTLSKNIVTDLLKKEMGFKGLIFTDALNMKGVSKFYAPGVVDVKALLAGNDVLLFSEDVPVAISEIKKAIETGEISQQEIDLRCKKILQAKEWAGLRDYTSIDLKDLEEDLNTPDAQLMNLNLVENSLTLLQNKDSLIPLKNLDTLKIAALNIGYPKKNKFQETLELYAPVNSFSINKEATGAEVDTILKQLDSFNLVVISIDNTNNNPVKNFGITEQSNRLISRINLDKKVILSFFGNPYGLSRIENPSALHGLVMSYEDSDLSQFLTAQLIFGGIAARGRLPITASNDFPIGSGIITDQVTRFKYTLPEEVGMSSEMLARIDDIANDAIAKQATPGCQVLVAKNGKVIYQKSFGYHTYENKVRVKNSDIYDLASITKIAASVPAVMKLNEEERFLLDYRLCDYLPVTLGTNKEQLVLREILAHQAGLKSWIPFFMKTVDKSNFNRKVYGKVQSAEFPYRVSENLYIQKNYPDSMMRIILKSDLRDKKEYFYSDLGYYFMMRIIERQTGKPMNEFVDSVFYKSLGLSTMGFRPREKFSLSRIIPTEYDMTFRKQLVHGDVHDPGAAMLGGVGGHAGLFSNSNDLAVLMQMYLQGGSYGGKQYLKPGILNEYTDCQFKKSGNRRGAGFDKPEMDITKDGPTANCVSYLSYGHTGFTGTMAWADPADQLVYVFLSNRVYPDAENKKLIKMGIRTRIQQVIYDSMQKKAVN